MFKELHYETLADRNIRSFFVPYLLVFLLPFLILSSILFYSFFNNTHVQMKELELNKLEQANLQLKNVNDSLNQISSQISYDTTLTENYIKTRAVTTQTKDTIQSHMNSLPFVDEIFIYYPESSRLYSSLGHYTDDVFIYSKLKLFDLPLEEALMHFKENRSHFFTLKNSDDKNYLFYSTPILTSSKSPHGYLIYMLNKTYLDYYLSSSSDTQFILMDSNNQIITYLSANLDEMSNHPEKLEQIVNFSTTIDDSYLLELNSNHPFRLISLVPISTFNKPLRRMLFDFLIIGLILGLIGLIFCLYFALRQYLPIKKMREKLDVIPLSSIQSPVQTNIVNQIQSTVSRLIEMNTQLNESLYSQQYASKLSWLLQLTEGRKISPKESELLAATFADYDDVGFFTILVDYASEKSKNKTNNDKSLFVNSFPILHPSYEVDCLEVENMNDYFILICHYDMTRLDSTDVVYGVQKYIESVLNLTYPIYVGQTVELYEDIYSSFTDALFLKEYQPSGDKDSTIFVMDDQQNIPSFDFDYFFSNHFVKIQKSLTDGNTELCHKSLNEMTAYFEENPHNRSMAHFYLYEIVNLCLKVSSQMNITVPIKLISPLESYTHFDVFVVNLRDLVDWLCNAVNEKKEQSISTMKLKLFDRIEESFSQIDFTLEILAIEFDYSTTYLNRIIKDETGLTYSKYIQKLRLDYVKQELIETDKTAKDIILESGYQDVSNFFRYFKKTVGCTPGDYRILHQNAESELKHT